MKNAQGPTVNPEPGNLSRHFVGLLSRWTDVGSVGVSRIETRAPALLRAFSFHLGVFTGVVVFDFPENPSLSSFLFFHKPYKGNNQVDWRERYSETAHGPSGYFFKNQNRF